MKITIKQLKTLIKEEINATKSRQQLTAPEIVAGYDDQGMNDGEQRLDMLGAFTNAKTWTTIMRRALEPWRGTYNEFIPRKIGIALQRLEQDYPDLRFAPGRENSVVLYISGDRESILGAWKDVQSFGADEVDILSEPSPMGRSLNPKSNKIPEQAFIRVWWD